MTPLHWAATRNSQMCQALIPAGERALHMRDHTVHLPFASCHSFLDV